MISLSISFSAEATLLFQIFLIGWICSWLVCYNGSDSNINAWGNNELIPDVHFISLVLAASLSLLGLIPEYFPWSYST